MIADIDALVDEQLAPGPHEGWHRPLSRIESGAITTVRCEVCGAEWHGLANKYGCPSEFGTDEEIEAYRRKRNTKGAKNSDEKVFIGDVLTNVQVYGVIGDIDPVITGTLEIVEGTVEPPVNPVEVLLGHLRTMWEAIATLLGVPADLPPTPDVERLVREALSEAGLDDGPILTAHLWLPGDPTPDEMRASGGIPYLVPPNPLTDTSRLTPRGPTGDLVVVDELREITARGEAPNLPMRREDV